MDETHPYNSIYPIPVETRILIVGTGPPQRFSIPPDPGSNQSKDVWFYYGSQDNELWSTIFPALTKLELVGNSTERRDQMLVFLKSNRIWMHEVFKRFRRTSSGSSLDNHLELVEAEDFAEILAACPSIEHLIFTGGRAERETCRKLVQQRTLDAARISGEMPRTRRVTLRIDRG